MILINFKTYEEATGKKAVELAKTAEKVALDTGKKIIIVPQTVDIFRIRQEVDLPIFSQHVDEIDFGSNTGHILIESVKKAGATGTIINHSENRIPMSKIRSIIEKCRQKDFVVLVCAQDENEVEKIAKLKPDYVAYEPPELIGGDISVSTSKPEIIKKSVEKAGDIPLIVGAGVKSTQDVKISIDLDAKGILVASGIIKSKDPEQAIRDLLKGFN